MNSVQMLSTFDEMKGLDAMLERVGLLLSRANGQACISVHQLAASTLALDHDVQRFFDFSCTTFLLIVIDLRTVQRNFVARPDHMLCDRGHIRILFSTCFLCSFKRSSMFRSVSPIYTVSHSMQGTLYITPFLSLSGIEPFKPLHMAHFRGETPCATPRSIASGRRTLPIAPLIPPLYRGTDTHVNKRPMWRRRMRTGRVLVCYEIAEPFAFFEFFSTFLLCYFKRSSTLSNIFLENVYSRAEKYQLFIMYDEVTNFQSNFAHLLRSMNWCSILHASCINQRTHHRRSAIVLFFFFLKHERGSCSPPATPGFAPHNFSSFSLPRT